MAALLDRFLDTDRMLSEDQRTGQPLPKGREVLSELMHMAWPAIIETFMMTLITMADTKMVGALGYQAIAAVNLTNQPRFTLLAVFNALNVGLTAIISRKRGQDDAEGANRIMRQSLLLYMLAAGVLSSLAVVYAWPIMKFAGARPDFIDAGVTYFRIVIGGIMFNVLNLCINAGQRGAGNTKISMRTNVIANVVNVIFNFLLIEGRFGFPALGVAGAAIATTLGYVVAFSISLYTILFRGKFLRLRFNQSFRFRWKDMKPVITIGAAAGVEQVCMRIGFFLFAKIVASLGTIAYSTHSICQNINKLSFCFGDGLGIAASALVGQYIGRKRYDIAALVGKVAQRIGMCMGFCLTVIMAVFGRYFVMAFSTEPEIVRLGGYITLILAILCPMQISQVIFSNCLRVAGDVRYTTLMSFISITFVRTVSGFIFCKIMNLGVMGAWYSFLLDQTVRLVLCATRFHSGHWRQIRLDA